MPPNFFSRGLPRSLSRRCHRPRTELSPSNHRLQPPHQRLYHSPQHPDPPAYPSTEAAILTRALDRVPEHGFTDAALRAGARDAGCVDAAANLFPRGPTEIAFFHLVKERAGLDGRARAAGVIGGEDGNVGTGFGAAGGDRVAERVRGLVLERLRANRQINSRWQEALALMATPSNVPPSLAELARLVDEICHLAGDTAVDGSWYAKRASLATLYAAAEVYMTQDASSGFRDTERFVDSRLEEMRTLGRWTGNVGEWLGFTGMAVVNGLRSKGVMI